MLESSISSPLLLVCLLTWRCCHGVKAGSYDTGVVIGSAGGRCSSQYVTVADTTSFPVAGCYRKTTSHDHGSGFSYTNYKGKVVVGMASQPMVMWNLHVSFSEQILFSLPKTQESALFAWVFARVLFLATCRHPCVRVERVLILVYVVGVADTQGQLLVTRCSHLYGGQQRVFRRWCAYGAGNLKTTGRRGAIYSSTPATKGAPNRGVVVAAHATQRTLVVRSCTMSGRYVQGSIRTLNYNPKLPR